MIAEYERAQILERSRRGKRHRAHTGEVSVMSGAPYGYRYIRKKEEALAAYTIKETEASVVRRVYEMYTVEGLSIAEITRRLNREGIPPRRAGRWERSVVWGMLRNPAYRGVACFGKTRLSPRTQTRPQRRRGITTPSNTAGHQRPREEWIEIPVPALVTEETFARAQELLSHNKIRSLRRTIAPSVVQGLVGCAKCGYALSRTSTQTSARKIHYYKCIGSDSWRKLGGPVCDNSRFIRQELLDQIVWAEVVRLLEDPALIQQELDRRLAAARTSDPTRKREQRLQSELSQVDKGIERLLTAYQEELLSLEQLRERMPMLRQRQQALRAGSLQAITDQANDRAAFLRLAETLTAFLTRLRSAADSVSVMERQKIVRLLVKEILVGEDTITIRHSIPILPAPPQNGGSEALNGQNYLCVRGVNSPALANFALDGLERLLKEKFPTRRPLPSLGGKFPCVNLIRYADDFVITGRTKELLEGEIKPLVEQFLQERWLELSPAKTVITHVEKGFDFLGQNVRKYPNGRLLIKPSKKNIKNFLGGIRYRRSKRRLASQPPI